jgi:hypothetical protein
MTIGALLGGTVHVFEKNCRRCDYPPEYGPPTTIYNIGRGDGSLRPL